MSSSHTGLGANNPLWLQPRLLVLVTLLPTSSCCPGPDLQSLGGLSSSRQRCPLPLLLLLFLYYYSKPHSQLLFRKYGPKL